MSSIDRSIDALKGVTPEFDSLTEAINKVKEAVAIANANFGVQEVDQKALAAAVNKASVDLKKYITAQGQQGPVMQSISASVTAFSGILAGLNTSVAAGIDLAYGNINELVSLYQAQKNVISAQNTYTQALALQATAVSIYGTQSKESTAATIAANYVGALYTQSKANETQAQYDYATATAQNLATMATGFLNITNAMYAFIAAQAVFTTAELVQGAELELASAIPFGALAIGAGAGIVGGYELATHLPHKAQGGYIPETGPYYLHQGENVQTAGEVASGSGNAMPSVEIHIHASSNVDLPRVRQEAQTAIANAWLHAQKQRGVYG